MVAIRFCDIHAYVKNLLKKLGMNLENASVMADIFTEVTKRGVGHHDLYNFPSRIALLKQGALKPNPQFSMQSSYGAMESWDGDCGPGELINTFSMRRAIDLASRYGIGLCTMKNTSHYLCSMPYVLDAAKNGYVGFIIAKGPPTMGLPNVEGNLVSQSPIGYAFPVGDYAPVMLDTCLAYAAGENLMQKAQRRVSVPQWWGRNAEGKATEDPQEILEGVKYPIGWHKGFGLAILCELLTGVLSQGCILDDTGVLQQTSMSHTAIAIKTDALMTQSEYALRSRELVDRIRARAHRVHVPGDDSWRNIKAFNQRGYIDLEDNLVDKLNEYALEIGVKPLKAIT